MAKISIIVPIYKVEPYLGKCVDSIISQTFHDFELILVDDGSPDRCGAMCDEYAKRDGRIRVVHQVNQGLSAARNVGLDIATGEWILFIDSDDWIDEGYLKALVSAAVEHGVGVALSNVCQVWPEGKVRMNGPEKSTTMSPSEVYARHGLLAVWACGKLFRRNLIGSLRFPVGKIQEDEFFTYKVLFECPEVVVVSDVSYRYLQRKDSLVGGKWGNERLLALDGMFEQRAYFRENGLDLADFAVTRRLFLWMSGALISIRKFCPEDIENQSRIVREIEALLTDDHDYGMLKRDPACRLVIRKRRNPRLKRLWRLLYIFEMAHAKGIKGIWKKISSSHIVLRCHHSI